MDNYEDYFTEEVKAVTITQEGEYTASKIHDFNTQLGIPLLMLQTKNKRERKK